MRNKLLSIDKIDSNEVVTYNIRVKKNKNYLANSILVHNKCCFKEGSYCTMYDGTKKLIEKIVLGDSILSYNFESNQTDTSTVTQLSVRVHSSLVKIELSNGTHIECTVDHPLYVLSKGWASQQPNITFSNYKINVKKLEIGDECFTQEGEKVQIIQLTEVKGVNKTYNISGINNNNNYFVNGILISNER